MRFRILRLAIYLLCNSGMQAQDINQRLQDCLQFSCDLNQNTASDILQKLKPLIDNPDHHAHLENFITYSQAQLQSVEANLDLSSGLPSDEAVIAAPDFHEIVAQNSKVRVLWGTSSNSEQEPLHRHYLPSILIMLDEGNFEIEYADGSKEICCDPIGVYELPADPQAAAYKNIGNKCSFLRFEFK